MKFRKKKEKDGESTMWKYAKYAVVAVCVIGIGASSISVIPTGYTGVKSTFGKISEKELTTINNRDSYFCAVCSAYSDNQ